MARLHAEDLAASLQSDANDAYDKDMLFWAFMERHDVPLAHYNEHHWSQAHQEGDPSARAISNMSSLLAVMEESWQKVSLEISGSAGSRVLATIRISDPRIGHGVSRNCQLDTGLSGIPVATASAFCVAHEQAIRQEMKLQQVRDVKMPDSDAWSIEPCNSGGGFAAVDHAQRLACARGPTANIARRNIDLNHKGPWGVMNCRDRYEAYFAPPQPSEDCSGPGLG